MINPDLTVDLHNHIIDNQTFDCICGKTYKTQAGLKQHQRRYCDGQFPDDNCTICGKVWTKKQSFNQHMRHRHPTEYNLTMKEEASRTLYKQWFPREIEKMAEAEARYNGKKLNSFLIELTGRSIDSVKNRRKRKDYKDMVANIEKKLDENLVPVDESLVSLSN
ncbi:hypothetical protein CBL_12085 [Carabus blaptoides fortunei]